eukprot:g3115.t1
MLKNKRPIVPVKEGYLHKLKRNRKQVMISSWNKRYFVLEKGKEGVGLLAYYTNAKKKGPGTRIVLDSIKAVRVFQGTQFQIESSQRNFTLRAESEEVALQWVNMLEAYRRKLIHWKEEQTRPISAASSNSSVASHTLSTGTRDTLTDSLTLSPFPNNNKSKSSSHNEQELEEYQDISKDKKKAQNDDASVINLAAKFGSAALGEAGRKETLLEVEDAEESVPRLPTTNDLQEENHPPVNIPSNVPHGWSSPSKPVVQQHHASDKVVAFGEPLGIQPGAGRKSRTPSVKNKGKKNAAKNKKIIRGGGIQQNDFNYEYLKMEQRNNVNLVVAAPSTTKDNEDSAQHGEEDSFDLPNDVDDKEKMMSSSDDGKLFHVKKRDAGDVAKMITKRANKENNIMDDEASLLLESTDSFGVPPPPPSAEPKDLLNARSMFHAAKTKDYNEDDDFKSKEVIDTEAIDTTEEDDYNYDQHEDKNHEIFVEDSNDGAIDDSHVLPSLPSPDMDESKEEVVVTKRSSRTESQEGTVADPHWLNEDWDD